MNVLKVSMSEDIDIHTCPIFQLGIAFVEAQILTVYMVTYEHVVVNGIMHIAKHADNRTHIQFSLS